MKKERKRWVVYSSQEIIKNKEKWVLKREFGEFYVEKEALKYHEVLKRKYGDAQMEVKKIGKLFDHQ